MLPEYRVGLCDLCEASVGAVTPSVAVGVVEHGESIELVLNLLLRGLGRHSQDGVEVGRGGGVFGARRVVVIVSATAGVRTRRLERYVSSRRGEAGSRWVVRAAVPADGLSTPYRCGGCSFTQAPR